MPITDDDAQTRLAKRELVVFLTIFSTCVVIGFIILLIFLMRIPGRNG